MKITPDGEAVSTNSQYKVYSGRQFYNENRSCYEVNIDIIGKINCLSRSSEGEISTANVIDICMCPESIILGRIGTALLALQVKLENHRSDIRLQRARASRSGR